MSMKLTSVRLPDDIEPRIEVLFECMCKDESLRGVPMSKAATLRMVLYSGLEHFEALYLGPKPK